MDVLTALKETEAWPMDDQLKLVQQLWDRIVESGWAPELTEAQKTELDRRVAELDANPNDVVSWESIVKHVRRQR